MYKRMNLLLNLWSNELVFLNCFSVGGLHAIGRQWEYGRNIYNLDRGNGGDKLKD